MFTNIHVSTWQYSATNPSLTQGTAVTEFSSSAYRALDITLLPLHCPTKTAPKNSPPGGTQRLPKQSSRIPPPPVSNTLPHGGRVPKMLEGAFMNIIVKRFYANVASLAHSSKHVHIYLCHTGDVRTRLPVPSNEHGLHFSR